MTASSLKSFLVSTPFYRALLEIRSFFQWIKIRLNPNDGFVSTSYCISPYKSGTTYFAGLFSGVASSNHEPLMHVTIRNIDDLQFLKRRAIYLNLDLECSGFFAGRLSLLRRFAPQARVVFLSRHPEEWIGSVVNYFSKLNDIVSYNYVARLIFDPICGVPIENFFNLGFSERKVIVSALMEYWLKVYQEAEADDNVMIVPLLELDDRIEEVASFLGLPVPSAEGVWKRENAQKKEFSISDYIDADKYYEAVYKLGYSLR